MQFEEFKNEFEEISNRPPKSKGIKTTCPDCDRPHEISHNDLELGQLITRFIVGDSHSFTQDAVLEQFKRLNEACKVVTTRSHAEDVLLSQASRIFCKLARVSSSFDEFRQTAAGADTRLTIERPSKVSVRLIDLIQMNPK